MSKPTTRPRDRAMKAKLSEPERKQFLYRRWVKAAKAYGLQGVEEALTELGKMRTRYRATTQADLDRDAINSALLKAERAEYQAAIEADRQRLLDLKPSYTPLLSEMQARMARLVHPDDAAQDAHVRQVLGV